MRDFLQSQRIHSLQKLTGKDRVRDGNKDTKEHNSVGSESSFFFKSLANQRKHASDINYLLSI